MLKMTLRGILNNKIRFFLTSIAVVLGVTFVVSAFVVTDGLRSTFGDLSSDIYSARDLTVMPDGDKGGVFASEEYLDQIAAIDGVTNVSGQIFANQTIPVDANGDVPDVFGPPVAGINWTGNTELDRFVLLEGEAPASPTDFALDVNTFDEGAYTLGETYSVISEAGGIREFTLTGIFRFGLETDDSIGAKFVAFENETAQSFLGRDGGYDEIAIAVDDAANIDEVQAQVAGLLASTDDVLSGEETVEEFTEGFDSFLGPFRTILLTFAFVILFVSAFLINNTFTIVIGQRIRELGLLRAIGAGGGQVRRSVFTEALIVGLVSTLIGIGLGLLGARALIALLESQGADFPDGPLPLEPRTIVFALLVGVLVTLLSALLPARRAAAISPMEALRENSSLDETRTGRRTLIGGLLALVGIGATALGLFGSFDGTAPRLIVLGVGAVVAFIAVAVLSPLAVSPVVRLIGAPIAALGGPAGKMAKSNATRSPQRTAGTAVALTIGLALVTTVTIIGASLKTTVSDALSSSVTADYIVFAGGALPAGVVESVEALPEIGKVGAFGGDRVTINGEEESLDTLDFATIDDLIDADLTEGAWETGGGNMVLYREKADELGLAVGDTVGVETLAGEMLDFSVSGLFDDNTFLGSFNVDTVDYERFARVADFTTLVASGADGTMPEDARAALDSVLEPFPQLTVQDQAEFLDETESQINQLLAIVNVFLGLAVLIALIGIVNTLTLSVFERTRELGLLRAVGMTRRQMRRMVRWESVIVSVFGAVLGVSLGVVFGWAISDAIPDDIVANATFPLTQLAVFILAAVVVGLLAAIMPARRAAKLNILDAISHS